MVNIAEHLPDRPFGQPRRSALRDPRCFAALDLGTSNCRLLIAAPEADGFRIVDSFSRTVRLGEGLHGSGVLAAAAMERTLEALEACAARLRRREVRGLRAVATQACRQASNSGAFLARVRVQTGLAIDVISTREEAELALESCAALLAPDARRALLFDIGGGSTELGWVRLAAPGATPGTQSPSLIGYASLPVGVVSLAERFAQTLFTPSGFAAMVRDVTARLADFERVHCIGRELRLGGVQLLATSGAATTLAGVALGLPRYSRPLVDGAVLSDGAIQAALTCLLRLADEGGQAGLASHPCVGPERAAMLMPGCAIFRAIHSVWPAATVTVADRGLREGMLLRMMRAGLARPLRGSGHARIRQPGHPPAR